MKTRASFLAAGVAALLMCSCASQAELDKARAEAEAARAEAEALKDKAEAEEKAKLDAIKRKEEQKKVLGEAMKRWNAVAAGMTFQAPNFGQINFQWGADQFPHPTFKGGSAEAYGAFAQVFLKFLEAGDNFEFLAKNDLFTAELRYGLASGQVSKWTFAKLADQFSQPNGHGNHDAATRQALQAFAEKMKASRKV